MPTARVNCAQEFNAAKETAADKRKILMMYFMILNFS